MLRDRGKTRWHLPCLHAGLKNIPRERRRPRDAAAQHAVQLEALSAAAEAGRKDHDRWLMTRNLLARKLTGRRATSKLPALLDYVLTRPIVSAGMIAAELGLHPRAAQNLVVELGLREATGRGRYRGVERLVDRKSRRRKSGQGVAGLLKGSVARPAGLEAARNMIFEALRVRKTCAIF